MPRVQAVLIDVYETALTCDFRAHDVELPGQAGVPEDVWVRRSGDLAQSVMDGRLTLEEAFGDVIKSTGRDASSELLQDLVRLDRRLLLQGSSVYGDTAPFLRQMRGRGVKTAFVSNCAENTRALLEHFQLSDLVDAIVLSYEVGYLKPSPEVYQAALEQLAAEPECALFVDDQESYCAGADALGIRAIRVDRQGRRRGTAVTGLQDLVQVVDFETA